MFPDAITLDFSFNDAAGNTVTAFSTTAFSINPDGVVVGQYALTNGGALHGFAAVPTTTGAN